MANFDKYAPFLRKWEGGFVNDPDDPGGATNMGVTLITFRRFFGPDKGVDDLRAMTEAQWKTVMKSYWDRVRGDEIDCQAVAEMLADWHINAGVAGIKAAQWALGVKNDGIVGAKTLAALNRPGGQMFQLLKDARIGYYKHLVENNFRLGKFLKGWIRRVEAIEYE